MRIDTRLSQRLSKLPLPPRSNEETVLILAKRYFPHIEWTDEPMPPDFDPAKVDELLPPEVVRFLDSPEAAKIVSDIQYRTDRRVD